ncbi:HpsJ-like protein, cyanoexosortase A-associated [Lyngbya confervoides]|uniref:HpsJ family protein n=1 Tax=Lyngbya confervoides BDU141951 TaxID=1574623 RepID=A0ABD4T987_9CYAN|nr:HpsJ family protein [Lyngbya confervoides]MCM1984890.1 HpsJ family protein [Lyngbya confervoides BDU141951]
MHLPNTKAVLPGYLFRLVGYGLLILAFFNLIDILFPLQIMNPPWEFQTFGSLVESSPIPLLGLALVFYGKFENRRNWELLVLSFLSWTTLLLGICSFLMIPGGLSSAHRINLQNSVQLNAQANQQIDRIQQLQNQLNQATAGQLKILFDQVTAQNPELGIQTAQDLKERLRQDLDQVKNSSRAQIKAEQKTTRLQLIKRALKWSFGGAVSGFLYIQIWRGTRRRQGGSHRKSGR